MKEGHAGMTSVCTSCEHKAGFRTYASCWHYCIIETSMQGADATIIKQQQCSKYTLLGTLSAAAQDMHILRSPGTCQYYGRGPHSAQADGLELEMQPS